MAMTRALVSGDEWWKLCDRGGWSKQLRDDTSVLIRPSTVAAFNKVYREQMNRQKVFMATIRHSAKNYQVKWDYWDLKSPPVQEHQEQAYRAFRAFAHGLLRAGRVRLACPTWQGYGSLDGFCDEDEARTAEVLVGEAFAGNPCGTVRAVWALAGRGLDQLYAEGGDPELAVFPPEASASPRMSARAYARSKRAEDMT